MLTSHAADNFLSSFPAPAYSSPASEDLPQARALKQHVRDFVSSQYHVSSEYPPRFFKVAADATPDMIRKNFSNWVIEHGSKSLPFDGPELFDHDLNILALFESGLMWNRKIFGIAMSETHPGQMEDALVIYFVLEPAS